MPVGWAKDYRRRLNTLARSLLHERGLPWKEALAKAVSELQCGARTRAGHPCRRKGRGAGGRCEKHGGLSTGAKTPEGRGRLRQNAKAQPRFNGRWATRAEIEAMHMKADLQVGSAST